MSCSGQLKTSQELRMMSRSLFYWQSLSLNVMSRAYKFVRKSKLKPLPLSLSDRSHMSTTALQCSEENEVTRSLVWFPNPLAAGSDFFKVRWGPCLVTPDHISTFSNIFRHTGPLLTLYHLIPSSTNLY